MAEEKNIYPKGLPNQSEDFSDNQKFKSDVYEAIQEIALSTTKKAFESLGYEEKSSRAGEYGNGESYGKGTENNEFNVKLTAKPNTNTYFEKVIYFGGKKAISEVSIGWLPSKKSIELTYKTSEFAAFRGYHEKTSYDGAQLVNNRSNFVITSIPTFKKELSELFKKFANKEVAYITSTKIGIEDKTEKSINSMVENNMPKKTKLNFSDLFNSSFDEALDKVMNYVNEGKKETENNKKVEKNPNAVVKANTKGDLLFDEKEEKDEEITEMTTAGSAAVAATGGEAPNQTLGSIGQIKYAANPFGHKFEDTPYAKAQKPKNSPKKTKNEGDTFWTKVELNPNSGYVPKGMEHNFELGNHSKNTDSNYPGKLKESKEVDEKLLKESLVKRKFTSLLENKDKGINKRLIITEQRTQQEKKDRWKSLSLFETYSTIRDAEDVVSEELLNECGCEDSNAENLVTMQQGQNSNEEEFMQRNDGAEEGDMIDGKEVVIVAKPNSLSNALYKVYKDDYLNENKAFILDLNSGNLIYNPNFKTGVEYEVKINHESKKSSKDFLNKGKL